jgi:hypothetical protein
VKAGSNPAPSKEVYGFQYHDRFDLRRDISEVRQLGAVRGHIPDVTHTSGGSRFTDFADFFVRNNKRPI